MTGYTFNSNFQKVLEEEERERVTGCPRRKLSSTLSEIEKIK